MVLPTVKPTFKLPRMRLSWQSICLPFMKEYCIKRIQKSRQHEVEASLKYIKPCLKKKKILRRNIHGRGRNTISPTFNSTVNTEETALFFSYFRNVCVNTVFNFLKLSRMNHWYLTSFERSFNCLLNA